MDKDIRQKCEIVADNFQWWATTANRYLEEDNELASIARRASVLRTSSDLVWTAGRIQFVEERYQIFERIEAAFEKHDWKLIVPGDVKAATWPLPFSVRLSVAVQGFKSKEYVHILNPKGRPHLILYRTKDKAKALEQGAEVNGKVWATKKVLFAGRQFPVASKVSLK